LDLINRHFQLRTCTMEINGRADRPCLEYHIKRCLGPCVKELCALDHYNEAVRDVEMLLEGKTADLEAMLKERMVRASDELRFEAAARYRDQLKTIAKLGEQQKMMLVSGEDRALLEEYLTTQRGRRVHISAPQRGVKRDLIDLVEKNARLNFDQRFRVQRPDMTKVLQELQEVLELPELPDRIESFDISNIQGDENV